MTNEQQTESLVKTTKTKKHFSFVSMRTNVRNETLAILFLLIPVKWIRDNMLELVESVTTEGGASSDEANSVYRLKRKK